MVLRVDHISFSCGNDYSYENILPPGYTKQFEEIGLLNISCKKGFLKNDASVHNIYMYSDETGIPIEITQYPKAFCKNEAISFAGRDILWKVKNPQKAKELFNILGGKIDENGIVQIRPFFEKNPISISFKENSGQDVPYLDVNGFSSLGLFVDDTDKEMAKLAKEGYFTTDSERISVNGKQLSIGFVKGFSGEIVELISLSRK